MKKRRLSFILISSHTKQIEGNSMFATIKALRKNIHGILISRDIFHRQFILSNNILDEMMMHVEVFNASMKNWILDDFQSAF